MSRLRYIILVLQFEGDRFTFDFSRVQVGVNCQVELMLSGGHYASVLGPRFHLAGLAGVELMYILGVILSTIFGPGYANLYGVTFT